MKIRPVTAVTFHAGGRAGGLTDRRTCLWVRTQAVALVTFHDGGTSLKGSNVKEF